MPGSGDIWCSDELGGSGRRAPQTELLTRVRFLGQVNKAASSKQRLLRWQSPHEATALLMSPLRVHGGCSFEALVTVAELLAEQVHLGVSSGCFMYFSNTCLVSSVEMFMLLQHEKAPLDDLPALSYELVCRVALLDDTCDFLAALRRTSSKRHVHP